MNAKLVAGVGVYEKGKYRTRLNGILTREYTVWSNMITRCYSEKKQIIQPAYIGCEVSENFKNFQFFAEWCQDQVGFEFTDYHLDKDIILKGNKLYAEHTCFFVPREINNFLTKRETNRGNQPIGVSFYESRGIYQVNTCADGHMMYLGSFPTAEEAFYTYKTHKENKAKQLANKYQGVVHNSVTTALMNYVVDITD